jgi:hypothetical protein
MPPAGIFAKALKSQGNEKEAESAQRDAAPFFCLKILPPEA